MEQTLFETSSAKQTGSPWSTATHTHIC